MTLKLQKYRQACNLGRGAIFLSVARGKIAEGIDFEHHYGRCVLILGFPVQNSYDILLNQRITYLIENMQLKDRNQFFEFDTMKQCSQCLGRVIRSKNDYGLMILADKRFKKYSRYSKLPQWIRSFLLQQNIDISVEAALTIIVRYFQRMGKAYKIVMMF